MRVKGFVLSALVLLGMVTVEEHSGLLSEGDDVPEFAATINTGEIIRSQDFRGKKNLVMSFYPKDFTSGCTQQVCALRDSYEEITNLDAVLFGVSRDDRLSHMKFIAAYRLPFQLIIDKDESLHRAFGTLRLGGLLPPKRVTYIIDKAGIIQRVIHHELRIGRHASETIEALRTLAGSRMPRE